MKNRKLLLVLSLLLALTVSLTGTLAYLTDTDSDVNVMTLGNVKIEQLENDKAEGGFEQAQPLYPAYYDDTDGPTINATGAVEKRVDVKNTGKSDAFVRTVFAFEAGELTKAEFDQYIHLLWNNVTPVWETEKVTIEGEQYFLAWYVYPDKIPAGQLAGETLQGVVMDKTADGTVMTKLGDNDYNILVVTQAVQTNNLDTLGVDGALNEAFGALSKDSHPWIDVDDPSNENDQEPDDVILPKMIHNYGDLQSYMTMSGSYIIGSDFVADGLIRFAPWNIDATIDLNGKTIEAGNKGQFMFYAGEDSQIHLTGDGTANAGKGFLASKNGVFTIDGGTYNMTATQELSGAQHGSIIQNDSKIVINDGTFTINVDNATLFMATSNAILEINGGFFENTADKTPDLINIGTYKNNTNRVILKGGTFVNWNPLDDRMCYTGKWPDSYDQLSGPWILVWDGYKVDSEIQDNGDVWYSVVPK